MENQPKVESIGRKLHNKVTHSSWASLSGILCMIVTFAVIVQLQNNLFLSPANILNIFKQVVVYGLLSLAMAIPLINGTFDMSISSIAAMSGMIAAMLCTGGLHGIKMSFAASVIVAIVICGLIGLINGLVITYTSISAFIATLGTQTAVRGLVYIICDNKPVGNLPDVFSFLGFSEWMGIPVSVIIMIVTFIIVSIVLNRTSFGRKIFANGGNYVAAYQSGINVKRVRVMTYVLSGAIAAIAGILLTARSGSAQPTAANGYEAIAISTCAMGGLAMHGGAGSVLGVFLGSVMMGMISNGMNLMKIDSNWQLVVRGVILIVSVLYSLFISKRAAK